MKDEAKTKKQLIAELRELRQFVGDVFYDYNDLPDLTDLSRVREAFQQVRQSQEKFMKAFLHNALPMGLTSHKNDCFVDVNDAFLRFSGFKRNDVMGNTVTALGLISSEQRQMALEKLNSRGRIENLEIKIMPKSGKVMRGLLNVVLMTIGKEKYRLIVVADITSYRQASDASYTDDRGLGVLPIDRPMPWYIG